MEEWMQWLVRLERAVTQLESLAAKVQDLEDTDAAQEARIRKLERNQAVAWGAWLLLCAAGVWARYLGGHGNG
jgi:ferric-dicitrate binding protein FerR (iron transport regulator)